MTDIILHHYPESPFSEKIRRLLAYKGVAYKSVVIPIIMPKPDLMPLTGGYRKTPVMQIGADIYCDTAIIGKVIDRLHPEKPVYPVDQAATVGAVAHWTDTFFFKVSVAVAFQPRGLVNNPILSDPEKSAAFVADRAEFSKGSTELRMAPEIAIPYFDLHLARLEQQLAAGAPFLFGGAPCIADFSTYHCLWFVHNNKALRDLFAPHANVRAWLDRMSGLGAASATDLSGADALSIARDATSIATTNVEAHDGLSAGDEVEILPIDYGLNPVRGKLVIATLSELAVEREDADVGKVVVHFPRLGFQVRRPG